MQPVVFFIIIIEIGFQFFSPYLGLGPDWEFQFKSMPDRGCKSETFLTGGV